MDAFVVKVHEETSKGMKRLYLYPFFLYTIKKSGKYFTLHTSVNFYSNYAIEMEGLLLSREELCEGRKLSALSVRCRFERGKFREDSLCVIAAGVRQGEINRRKSSAMNIMRIMQV